MKRSGFAILAATVLALAACGRKEEDATTNLENIEATSNLDELANETANQAETETLANQQAELENQDSADTNAANDVTPTEDPDENVSGM